MTIFLIYIFFKKYGNINWSATGIQTRKFLRNHKHLVFVSVIIILLLIPLLSRSQNSLLHYTIIQGGDDIGWMRLEKNVVGNKTNLLLISEIKTRFILQIEISTKETSQFENGQLLYSTQYRKTNGTIKLNKQTKRNGNKYEINNNGEKQYLSLPIIGTNILSLYFQEPVGFNSVYCDKHQCFINLIKTDDGGYKIIFPDGNSNTFYYSRGVCIKIKIKHSFCSAEIIKTT